jgi:hypothetical protein
VHVQDAFGLQENGAMGLGNYAGGPIRISKRAVWLLCAPRA